MQDIDNLSYEGEPIQLDKLRHLKFTFRGLKLLAKRHGSVAAAMEKLEAMDQNLTTDTLDDLVNLVHAALIHEDKTLTAEMVEDMLDLDVVGTISDKVMIAFMRSSPAGPAAGGGSEGTMGETL